MSERIFQLPPHPRFVRPVPDPLGLYLRVSPSDCSEMSNLIAAGDTSIFGVILDPTLMQSHDELRDQAIKHNLDVILDPKTQQSSFPGGYGIRVGNLPWGVGRPHSREDFEGASGRKLIGNLGDFAVANGFTQVLSPTHLLQFVDDQWLSIDIQSTFLLRNHLDKNGGENIPIIYSLAISYETFRDPDQRRIIINKLRSVPASSFWLKIERLGRDSTPSGVMNYITAATDFHELGKPIIAESFGGINGLSLLAFGAVGGLAHGIKFGESFDAGHWRKPREESGGPIQRVYFPSLDLMLGDEQAKMLLGSTSRAKGKFGCLDRNCCNRGVTDMLQRKARHFINQRMMEVSKLSRIPESLRPREFVDKFLRPKTYAALAASNINGLNEFMLKKTREKRKKLDSLLIALGNLTVNDPPKSFSLLPKSRIKREV